MNLPGSKKKNNISNLFWVRGGEMTKMWFLKLSFVESWKYVRGPGETGGKKKVPEVKNVQTWQIQSVWEILLIKDLNFTP